MSRAALLIYRVALRLLPGDFRARHRAELVRTVGAALAEEAARGRVHVWLRLVREVFDVLITSVRVDLDGAPPARARGKEGDGMTGVLRQLRISALTLVRRPAYALAATLTLGAGVGCAAAAFAVLDTLLLQPLPHRAPGELVMVWRDPGRGGARAGSAAASPGAGRGRAGRRFLRHSLAWSARCFVR